MTADVLERLRDVVQHDVAGRGLRTDPQRNLITETAGDFRAACSSLARAPAPVLVIVTGFFIPTADPPAAETDGPLGAVFLARALTPLGMRVVLACDSSCSAALTSGLAKCGLEDRVAVAALPMPDARSTPQAYHRAFVESIGGQLPTHLLAIERVGPNHTLQSLRAQRRMSTESAAVERDFTAEVSGEHRDRCHTMRGIDITDQTAPAHRLFEAAHAVGGITTIGIGDGGNEIGMGKIAWEVVRANIPRGGLIACRVRTDHLVVSGVSNWGAYAIAAGVHALRGIAPPPGLFDSVVERQILEVMVERGPLVDGVRGRPGATVDGLTWEQYAAVLPKLQELMQGS